MKFSAINTHSWAWSLKTSRLSYPRLIPWCADMAFIMVYLLLCYHWDKLEKHLVSYPPFLSYSPWQLYFSHLFFHSLSSSFISPFKLSVLSLFCVSVCLCACLCVRAFCVYTEPWKVGSSNHKLKRSTFSLHWNERNEHFWMKWSRTLHSNPNSFRPFISSCMASQHYPYREKWNKISDRSRSLVTSVISQECLWRDF